MRKTKKITVCAVMASLGVAILYMGSFMEVLDLSVSCAASLIILFCVEEMGIKYSAAVYFVISTLSFILLPQKWIAAYFMLFFGTMPITKKLYEKTGKLISWILKIVTFNIEILAFYYLAKYLDFFEMGENTLPYLLGMLLLANLVFVLTDLLYGKIYYVYRVRYQARIRKLLK